MNKDLFIYGHEGEEAYKVDPSTVEGQVEGLSAKLQGLRDDVNAKVIYVNSVRNVTVEGISVPELSEGQVLAIYNAIVNKQMVVVKSVDNSGHFVITQADALNGEISVVLIYYASALITYTTTAQGVEVSVQALGGGGGGGGGWYLHKIADSDEAYHFVISGSNTPYTGFVPQAIKNDLKAVKYASGYSFSQLDELEFGAIITTMEGAKYIMHAGGTNVACYACGNDVFSIVNDTVTEI